MNKRYLSIWLPLLPADRQEKLNPELKKVPLVFCVPEHGRMMVRAVNRCASKEGIKAGMPLADVRSFCPHIRHLSFDSSSLEKLLHELAEWCLRFTPQAAVDGADGLMLDISGCTHLWGGERRYLNALVKALSKGGYTVRAGIADTIGAAWGMARYGKEPAIAESGKQEAELRPLPPAALRLDPATLARMNKLGFQFISQFITIPAPVLRRRFGSQVLLRLRQALGTEPEALRQVIPIAPYMEHLPCPEPIRTATGIQMALLNLLKRLCERLIREGKGVRHIVFKSYRVDEKLQQMQIGTNSASRSPEHLFKLFEHKICSIDPGLGIELFILEAARVENLREAQHVLWDTGSDRTKIAELLDTIAGRLGRRAICRYLPQESHWPERSFTLTRCFQEQPLLPWPEASNRPLHLLACPEPVEIMAPLPDYPPLLFRYKGKVYRLVRADGPERIKEEWWVGKEEVRDYYKVEDEHGARYWLFRKGLYEEGEPRWYLHGYFA